jgi:4'-phosphopantetheinyl transferase
MITLTLNEPDEIHLWLVRDHGIADPALLDQYRRLLDPQEAARLERFVFPKHRHQYLVARALLRSVLSIYDNAISPADWRFEANPYGKPSIAVSHSCKLGFNLSHTEQLTVLAVSSGDDIGVDVEWMGRNTEVMELAEHCFSPAEVDQLLCLPQERQRARFFDVWTLKEAYIKARGLGISNALHDLSFLFADDDAKPLRIVPATESMVDPAQWTFWHVAQDTPHKIAVARQSPSTAHASRLVIREGVPLHSWATVSPPVTRRWPGDGVAHQ